MASEKIGYNVFPALPVTGPVTSVAFGMDTATTGANVILNGTSFSARVQVSNAIVRGGPAHLFIPPDVSFDTAATLNAASPPTQVPGPFRYIRIVLDSGTLNGANIEETHGAAQSLDLNAASLAGQTAGAAAGAAAAGIPTAAIANTKAGLASKGLTDGPQFADGLRWVWQSTGPANGTGGQGTVVPGSSGFWKAEAIVRNNVRDFGAFGNGTLSDTIAIQKAVDALPTNGGEVFFPPGSYLIDGPGVMLTNRNGVAFTGVSRYGAQLLDGVVGTNMITASGCEMLTFTGFEWVQSQQKFAGAYLSVTNSHVVSCTRMRIQNPYRGLQFDNVGGIHLTDVKFVPQNVSWPWAAAVYVIRSAGLFATGLDINFGTNIVQEAGIVLEGGCDTMHFANIICNQIGGNAGGATGGKALWLKNTTATFDPRWVRFTNSAFEAAGGPAILISVGNDVGFVNCYAVNGTNALNIAGGSNIKWLGGVLAYTSQHVVEITGGKNILIDRATVASGSHQTTNTYSGVSIGVGASDVDVSNCNIGDNTTLPGDATIMANGVSMDNTALDKRHRIRDNRFGPLVTTRVYNGTATSSVLTRRMTEGTAAPTVGAWEAGDMVRNTAPTVAGAAASQYVIDTFICTVSGTPGTWVGLRSLTGT